jgi:hypothetical protein
LEDYADRRGLHGGSIVSKLEDGEMKDCIPKKENMACGAHKTTKDSMANHATSTYTPSLASSSQLADGYLSVCKRDSDSDCNIRSFKYFNDLIYIYVNSEQVRYCKDKRNTVISTINSLKQDFEIYNDYIALAKIFHLFEKHFDIHFDRSNKTHQSINTIISFIGLDLSKYAASNSISYESNFIFQDIVPLISYCSKSRDSTSNYIDADLINSNKDNRDFLVFIAVYLILIKLSKFNSFFENMLDEFRVNYKSYIDLIVKDKDKNPSNIHNSPTHLNFSFSDISYLEDFHRILYLISSYDFIEPFEKHLRILIDILEDVTPIYNNVDWEDVEHISDIDNKSSLTKPNLIDLYLRPRRT